MTLGTIRIDQVVVHKADRNERNLLDLPDLESPLTAVLHGLYIAAPTLAITPARTSTTWLSVVFC